MIRAYSPVEEGTLAGHAQVVRVAKRHDATSAQIAIAWVLRQPDVSTIPKAGNPEHVRENRGALDSQLTSKDLCDLDGVFEPREAQGPTRRDLRAR